MKILKKLLTFGLVLLGIYAPKALATDVIGILSSDTTWEVDKSPYVVTGPVLIESGVTLTVEAGVEVRCVVDSYIKVEGYLVARGTQSNKIVFTSNNDIRDWDGIRIRPSGGSTIDSSNGYVSGSIFEHVNFSYADTALYVYETGIYVSDSKFENNNNAI